jgi:diguanylate cyclase (GGDEF)-like protein
VSATDYRDFSMLELFKLEAETQTQVLTDALLVLEHDATSAAPLEACMRASHSLKGAARIVGLNPGVSVTHAMEDCFVAAQNGRVRLSKPQIDLLLRGVDLITKVANASDADRVAFAERDPPEVDAFVGELEALLAEPAGRERASPDAARAVPEAALDDAPAPSVRGGDAAASAPGADAGERALRVSAQNFNRLLGLSAQSLVESRWLGPFHAALLRLKRQQDEAVRALEALAEALPRASLGERAERAIDEARASWQSCRATLGERIEELDRYEARVTSTARRLHDEALTCRMRPFSDGVVAFPRLVRDVAQSLGKRARLEIAGEATAVDRDVLASLEAPLIHLLRNAVDHGLDPPEVRRAYHSRSHTNLRQRDAAYRALRESQQRLVELNLELQRLSRVDGLTGLNNRRYLDEFLQAEWRRATRERTPLAVLMMDIDDFKRYNDTYGHVAGDEALKTVGESLRNLLKRPADMAARYGGEEFTAVLPATSPAGAEQLAEQLRALIESRDIEHRGSSIGSRLTVSIGGAALVPERTESIATLLEAADRALYQAKRAGKNRVVLFDRGDRRWG